MRSSFIEPYFLFQQSNLLKFYVNCFLLKHVMQYLPPFLLELYNKDVNSLPKNDMYKSNIITCHEVLKAYYIMVDYFLTTRKEEKILVGLRDVGLLESAVHKQYTCETYMKAPTPHDVAAVLFYGLNKNHAFFDGNKRISLLIVIYYYWKLCRIFHCDSKKLEQFTVDVAANNLNKKNYHGKDTIDKIQNYLRRNTRKWDKRRRSITYQDFNTKIRRYNCFLSNPQGGTIDIYAPGDNGTPQKVGQIGFKSWKSQINPKAVKETLKRCQLTVDNGIDGQCFYEESDPLYLLLGDYEKPLFRLKDQ